MFEIPIGLAIKTVRAIYAPLVYAWKYPFSARRHVQNIAFWGVSWDLRGVLGMNHQGNGPIYVGCFQAFGVNHSKHDVRMIDGYLQSNIKGDRLPLLMEGMTPKETNGIPSKCRFFLQALFRDPSSIREGFPLAEFLQNWADFTLVFILDGKRVSHRFGRREVRELTQKFAKETCPKPAPLITRKVL